MSALKDALDSARSEHAEASRVHPDSRAGLLLSELSGDKDPSRTGGDNDGEEVDTPMMATSQDPPVLGERQQPTRHDYKENLPVSTSKRQERHTGVPAEQSANNNAKNTGRAAAAAASTLANSNCGQPDDPSVPRDITVVFRGTHEMPEVAAAAALAASPPGDAVAAEASRHPPSEPTVRREAPQHPERPPPEELSPRTARAEIYRLGRDLAGTRAAADEAAESRRLAEGRVGELEEVIVESERQHALFRERGEARLETLKLAFAQEQEEGGADVRRWSTFLLLWVSIQTGTLPALSVSSRQHEVYELCCSV